MTKKKSKDPDFSSLTERQFQIYQAIRTATVLNGYSPSIREIGDAVGLKSTSSVAYQLDILVKKGFLRREPHTPRTFNIQSMDSTPGADESPHSIASSEESTAQTPDTSQISAVQPVYVPVVGTIAAGTPIIAEENIEEYLPIPPAFTAEGELFALEVRGVSMTGAGILDGDWVVVRQQPEARSGDIVAACFEGDGDDVDATVKEYFIDHMRRPFLLAHYPDDYDGPGEDQLSAQNARILGKVVSVFRSL